MSTQMRWRDILGIEKQPQMKLSNEILDFGHRQFAAHGVGYDSQETTMQLQLPCFPDLAGWKKKGKKGQWKEKRQKDTLETKGLQVEQSLGHT